MSAPLFLQDSEEVKRLLRLTEITPGGVSEEVVEQAITDTKIALWEELGADKITELLALSAPAGQPSTDDDFMYLMSRRCELAIIRYNLTFSLSMGYRAGSVSFIESYSSEGQFRSLNPQELREYRQALWNDPRVGIGRQLAFLAGTLSGGEATGAKMALLGGESERQLLYYDPSDPDDILESYIS